MDARDAIAITPGPRADAEPASARSRGRPPIRKERIIATALSIIDDEGIEALSLRALAQRLDSSTATLYRHFANRAELINALVDHTFSGVTIEADELGSLGWEGACRALASSMFESLTNHPRVARLLLAHVPTGPNAMALRELALSTLLDAGFSPPVAIRCYATLARFVLGFAIQLNGYEADDATLAAGFRSSAERGFPATTAVAEFFPLDGEFDFGLNLLLAGLAQLEPQTALPRDRSVDSRLGLSDPQGLGAN